MFDGMQCINLFNVLITRAILFKILFTCESYFKFTCNVIHKKLNVLTCSNATLSIFDRKSGILFCGTWNIVSFLFQNSYLH